jgi:catechol 2,3-dioxygenase-like lactoylglutathione lyase family enzyme
MVSAIESVMLRVDDLESSLRTFRDELGLVIVSDGRASVGLLSAWRYPVHESVRLVELASGRPAVARLRLARFEDSPPSSDAMRFGPQVLDFRSGAPSPSAAGVRVGSAGQRWIAPAYRAGADPRSASETIAWVWVRTADLENARRFYADGLGFAERPLDEDAVSCAEPFAALLGVPAGARLRLCAVHSAEDPHGGVVLFEYSHEPPTVGPLRPVGRPGINLLSCRCARLDELIDRLEPLGIEPLSPPTHVGLPRGLPGRVMVVRGPNDELFEFIDETD